MKRSSFRLQFPFSSKRHDFKTLFNLTYLDAPLSFQCQYILQGTLHVTWRAFACKLIQVMAKCFRFLNSCICVFSAVSLLKLLIEKCKMPEKWHYGFFSLKFVSQVFRQSCQKYQIYLVEWMSAMWRDMKWRRISEINVPATLSLKCLLWRTNIKIVDKK